MPVNASLGGRMSEAPNATAEAISMMRYVQVVRGAIQSTVVSPARQAACCSWCWMMSGCGVTSHHVLSITLRSRLASAVVKSAECLVSVKAEGDDLSALRGNAEMVYMMKGMTGYVMFLVPSSGVGHPP